jgi:hypothetical protein
MSRFHRDDDLDHFDSTVDVTAGEQHQKRLQSNSVSPVKRSRDGVDKQEGDKDAAMASLRKRMAGRE